jgi:hypothetical protein
MADLGNVQVTEALKKCPFCLQAHDPKVTCPERIEAMRELKRWRKRQALAQAGRMEGVRGDLSH